MDAFADRLKRQYRAARLLLKQHHNDYVAMNVGVYGLVGLGMGAAMAFPSLHERSMARVEKQLASVQIVTDAYEKGEIFKSAGLTFATNLLVGSIGTITLPSAIVPFSGLALTVYRSLEWGLLLAPVKHSVVSHLPHYICLLVEGQAYVLSTLGALITGRMMFKPSAYGYTDRQSAWRAGLDVSLALHTLIVPILALAAIYEPLELKYFKTE